MPANNKKTLLLGGLVALVMLAIAVGAIADENDSSTGPGIAGIVGSVGKLRAAELPAVAATEVRSLGSGNVDPGRSVKALSQGRRDLYLTPDGDQVCVSVVDGSGATVNCLPHDVVANGSGKPSPSMVMSGCQSDGPTAEPDCRAMTIYGVVPDGVESVELDAPGNPTAEVVNNAYMLDVSPGQVPNPVTYR